MTFGFGLSSMHHTWLGRTVWYPTMHFTPPVLAAAAFQSTNIQERSPEVLQVIGDGLISHSKATTLPICLSRQWQYIFSADGGKKRWKAHNMSVAQETASLMGPGVVLMTFSATMPTWCEKEEQQIALLLGTNAWLAACFRRDSSDSWQKEAANRRLIERAAATTQLFLTFLLRTLEQTT